MTLLIKNAGNKCRRENLIMHNNEWYSRDNTHLDISWQWLCESRKSAPDNADIWDLRYRWPTYRAVFLATLQSGDYRLSPMQVVGNERHVMWGAEDALALKWAALQLVGEEPLHERCEHVKAHGGGSASIHRIQNAILEGDYHWVCRTDIWGYYGAINKHILLSQLNALIERPALRSLIAQYIYYSVEDGGEFYTPVSEIARGCALSPLMGALHLWVVDHYFAQQKKTVYARYMDNFILLTKIRWQLRRQVKRLNGYLAKFGFEQHPEKTFIGRVSQRFDWMGTWITEQGVCGVVPRALMNHKRPRNWSKVKQAKWVSEYKIRWMNWVNTSVLRARRACATGACVLVNIGAGTAVLASLLPVSSQGEVSGPPSGFSLQRGSNWVSNVDTINTYVAGTVYAPDPGNTLQFLPKPYGMPYVVSSDGKKSGWELGRDVILYLTGDINVQSGYSWLTPGWSTGNHSWVKFAEDGQGNAGNSGTCYAYYSKQDPADPCKTVSIPGGAKTMHSEGGAGARGYTFVTDHKTTGTLRVSIYAGPRAEPGVYGFESVVLSKAGGGETVVVRGGTIRVPPPLECTINTPPKIDFGKVNVWDWDGNTSGTPGGNRRDVLKEVDGYFTINCTGGNGAHSPAKLTLKGDTLQYANDLKMTMDSTGEVAPATVRASIKSIKPACDTGGALFNPGALPEPGNIIKLDDLVPGTNQVPYRFSLCSAGKGFKSGAASASATVTIDWE